MRFDGLMVQLCDLLTKCLAKKVYQVRTTTRHVLLCFVQSPTRRFAKGRPAECISPRDSGLVEYPPIPSLVSFHSAVARIYRYCFFIECSHKFLRYRVLYSLLPSWQGLQEDFSSRRNLSRLVRTLLVFGACFLVFGA